MCVGIKLAVDPYASRQYVVRCFYRMRFRVFKRTTIFSRRNELSWLLVLTFCFTIKHIESYRKLEKYYHNCRSHQLAQPKYFASFRICIFYTKFANGMRQGGGVVILQPKKQMFQNKICTMILLHIVSAHYSRVTKWFTVRNNHASPISCI